VLFQGCSEVLGTAEGCRAGLARSTEEQVLAGHVRRKDLIRFGLPVFVEAPGNMSDHIDELDGQALMALKGLVDKHCGRVVFEP